MPLIQVSMGAVLPNEVASAAGLQNFIRTMAGAVATNEIFIGATVVFALCACLAWTLPRPKGPVDMSSAH
jgi:MFS transporter, DHA2 family, multidrug resistance protein